MRNIRVHRSALAGRRNAARSSAGLWREPRSRRTPRSLRPRSPRPQVKSVSIRPLTSRASRRRSGYDMLVQVPSFTIKAVDTTDRGLGQASENVLINGQRIANKSGGAVDQLKNTPAASVERIEIVDAASLGIAGLSGQVANVILSATKKASGEFEYDANARSHYARPELYGGHVSYSGKEGPVDYTLSVKNSYGRGGLGGPIWIYDANHDLIEKRTEAYHSESSLLTFQGKFAIDGPGSSIGNLTLGYTPYWNPVRLQDRRILATGETQERIYDQTLAGYQGDISGDYEFALGPGRLKLIGLRHWDHEPIVSTDILHFTSSGADSEGSRFSRDSHIGETVTRGEYNWNSGQNNWQFSLERAYNSLDQHGRLFNLEPDGDLRTRSTSREGSGKVVETRYEAMATFSRQLRVQPRTCRSPPARRFRTSIARPTRSRRANSSVPKAASCSAGIPTRHGTSA